MTALDQTKDLLRRVVRSSGWNLSRTSAFGNNAFIDVAAMSTPPPRVVFDVGANEGQTADELRQVYPDAKIYCFEPYLPAFQRLQQKFAGDVRISLEHLALGERTGEATLFENAQSVTNSLLPNAPDAALSQPDAYATPTGQSTIPITTVDEFCNKRAVETIDLLKIDSQGYDLRILQGARGKLSNHRVNFILTEMLFAPLYSGQAYFPEIYNFVTDLGYSMVGLYAVHRSPAGAILWCDALFRCAARD